MLLNASEQSVRDDMGRRGWTTIGLPASHHSYFHFASARFTCFQTVNCINHLPPRAVMTILLHIFVSGHVLTV